MLKTTSGKKVFYYNTEEFAKLILSSPNKMHTFTTRLDDEDWRSWSWYSIISARMFDVRSIFINLCTTFGGAPFMFDLPDYDECVDECVAEDVESLEVQSDECLQEMVKGLSRFRELYEEPSNEWYVKEGYEQIQIISETS